MASTNTWEVTHGYRSIEWQPHVCPSDELSKILATPATSFLSIGFSAIAAGASIYNAYQLAHQKKILTHISQQLNNISQELNIVSEKLDYIVKTIDQLTLLTKEVLENTIGIKEIAYVKVFFEGALSQFEQNLRTGKLTIDSVKGLEGDIQQTFWEVASRKGTKDAPIPNWMIEKAQNVFSFFKILNMFLIESHNRLSDYNPTMVRRYEPIDRDQHYLNEDPTNELSSLISDIRKIHRQYKIKKINRQPRLKWLSAFLWEIKLFTFTQISSTVLSSAEPKTIMFPMLDDETVKNLCQLQGS